MEKMKFGLIGEKLGHSYSKEIHQSFDLYDYDLIEVDKENLHKAIYNPSYQGFNITIPYKKDAFDLCDNLSHKALKLGNVNSLVKKNGKLFGDNTDYDGLDYLFKANNIDLEARDVIILGNGSAAHTSYHVVKDLGARNIKFISRSGQINFKDMGKFSSYHIIINATPVGMYPNNGESLVDLDKFSNLQAIVDLVYNPYRTKLLLDGVKLSIKVVNGLEMLVYQAKKAGEIFTGQPIAMELYHKAYDKIYRNSINIALIGMPGVGKTTYGQYLSKETGRKLYSLDEEIEKREKKSCQDIILEKGEEYFRKIETEILRELSKKSGIIIDCGGGIVSKERNYPLLRQNSIIYWIQRDLKDLPKDGRPLSQKNSLEDLYKKRGPIYEKWADKIISL